MLNRVLNSSGNLPSSLQFIECAIRYTFYNGNAINDWFNFQYLHEYYKLHWANYVLLVLNFFPQNYALYFGILVMGVRLTSYWTAAAFTGLLSVPGWRWVKGWMNERTIFFLIFGKVEPTVEWYWQGKTEELGEKLAPVLHVIYIYI
jgi:hypothetical protein